MSVTLFEQGIKSVAKNNQEWIDAFNVCAAMLVDRNGNYTTDQVTEFIGMPPLHRNAVGAAAVKFARKHGLSVIGYTTTQHASRRTARIAIWGRA